MKKKRFASVALVLMLAGCVDNMDSISRDYRNTNNEAIDAMMMITTEAQAERMTVRIFKALPDRYEKTDKKLKILGVNTATNLEMVESVYESDGIQLYLADLIVNRKRFSLEMERLRRLHKRLSDDGQDVRFLAEIVKDTGLLEVVRKQLMESKIEELIAGFATKKDVPPEKYIALHNKFMAKRKELTKTIPNLIE